MRRLLWVFAHQDDEIAAAGLILAANRRGDQVWCSFLVDGGAHRRDESVRALELAGVSRGRISFAAFPDSALHRHLDAALAGLESTMDGISFDEVGCLAWEGGHQDHDAAHLVAAVFALRRGLPVWEVPLYNGAGVPGPFFRVLHPLGRGWERSPVALRDVFTIISMIGTYRSQRRSWIGLGPEAILKLLMARRVSRRRVDLSRARETPHRGRLFYERRFGCEQSVVRAAAVEFIARHDPDQPPRSVRH
jgi:LmbE family N-acetylglucosaminyl deacetylase